MRVIVEVWTQAKQPDSVGAMAEGNDGLAKITHHTNQSALDTRHTTVLEQTSLH